MSPAEDTGDAELCPALPAGGTAAGTADCSDDRCTIAAGSFWQGGDNIGFASACPAREVTLSAYAIGTREVTRARYATCVSDGACPSPDAACLDRVEVGEGIDTDDLPITCIDASAAEAFCAFDGGRLPTEAEWEKAARGTDGAAFPHGATPPTCTEANFRFASSFCSEGPLPPGQLPAGTSPFGLADAAGNVWEWTADAFDVAYYEDAPDTDPPGPNECREARGDTPGPCRFRVIRGGSFLTVESTLHTWVRNVAPPDTIDESIGVRCAYDATP